MSIKLAQTLNQLAKSTEAMIHGDLDLLIARKRLLGFLIILSGLTLSNLHQFGLKCTKFLMPDILTHILSILGN